MNLEVKEFFLQIMLKNKTDLFMWRETTLCICMVSGMVKRKSKVMDDYFLYPIFTPSFELLYNLNLTHTYTLRQNLSLNNFFTYL